MTPRKPSIANRPTMNRTTVAFLVTFALVSCDKSTSPASDPIPSGVQAPRTLLKIVAGTKDAPVDTPMVKITWWHQDTILLANFFAYKLTTSDSMFYGYMLIDDLFPSNTVVGSNSTKVRVPEFSRPSYSRNFSVIGCHDSAFVVVSVLTRYVLPGTNLVGGLSSYNATWVYCK